MFRQLSSQIGVVLSRDRLVVYLYRFISSLISISYLIDASSYRRLSRYSLYIETKTVKEYLKEINKHFTAHSLPPPWVNTAQTKTARLVRDKQTFETEAKRREPLTHRCIETMLELAEHYGDSEDCFECLMRDMVTLGRYTGNRIQEYAMDSPHVIKYYVTPDGNVMRAFSVGNILFRDAHGMPLATSTSVAMDTPNLVVQVGTRYDIQKNRNNGQVLWYHRDTLNPDYCPVVRALSLV